MMAHTITKSIKSVILSCCRNRHNSAERLISVRLQRGNYNPGDVRGASRRISIAHIQVSVALTELGWRATPLSIVFKGGLPPQHILTCVLPATDSKSYRIRLACQNQAQFHSESAGHPACWFVRQ